MLQKKHIFVCCFIFLVCLFTTACSNNDNSSNNTTLSGSAIKGIISNGIVSAYKIVSGDTVLLAQSRTNQFGQFNLNIAKENSDQLILLELSTDNSTRMRCDLTPGCIDQNSGAFIEFGEDISLPSFFKLFGVTSSQSNANQAAFISPLTHLVVATAKGLDDTLTREAINIASEWVKNALNLDISPTQVQLNDITNLSKLPLMTDEELKQSIISAAMYSETIEDNWALGNESIDSIDIKDILLRASNITNDLSSNLSESQNADNQANSLNRIQRQLDTQVENLSTSEIVILAQPSPVTLTEGQVINLYVRASSNRDLSYQWYKNDNEIQGANSAIYSKPDSELNDTGVYKVLINHNFNEVMSLSASVNINKTRDNFEITRQPQSQSITQGDPFQLRVETNQSNSTRYQWQKNGSIIPGATDKTYYIAKSSFNDAGNYRVTISNPETEISSNFVNVWVSESIEAVSITRQPHSKVVSEGTTVIFSVQASGDGFLRYQWRKNGIPIENAYLNAYRIPSVSIFDQSKYDVVVSNSQGKVHSKTVELSVLSNKVPLTITQHPQSKSVTLGHAFTLSVGASGGESLSYQWYFNGNAIKDATSKDLHITNTHAGNEGGYNVLVNNETSSQQSETSFISVSPPALKSVELTWDTPTEREDGTALDDSEIMGYVIEYGYHSRALDKSRMIEGEFGNSFTINRITASELFLRIATLDSDGNQGAFSDMIKVSF